MDASQFVPDNRMLPNCINEYFGAYYNGRNKARIHVCGSVIIQAMSVNEETRMKKILHLWIVGMSLVLAACGSKLGKPSTKIDVTMTDFQFSPNSFTVPAGQEITFTSSNTGGVVH